MQDVKVNIPAGIDQGQRIRYENEGHAGSNGGEKGSLYVEVRVAPHKLFVRNGFDIMLEVPVSIVDATLGTTISVPTLYGSKDIKIPEGTQSGTVFTIKNYGIKKLKGTGKGDMFVKVVVEVPKSVSKEQKEFLKRFDQITDQKKQYPLKKAYDEKAQ